MFLTATMSVLGLYQVDQTLFDLLRLPDGIDRATLVHSILLESANREVLYPDPAVLKNAIGLWSERSFVTWQKLLYTTTVEYDPISNYDRTESWTEESNDSRESEESGTSSTTQNQTSNRTEQSTDSLESEENGTSSTTQNQTSNRTEQSTDSLESEENGTSSTTQNQTSNSAGSVLGGDDGTSIKQIKAFNDQAFSDAEKTINNTSTTRNTTDQTTTQLTGNATDGRTISTSTSRDTTDQTTTQLTGSATDGRTISNSTSRNTTDQTTTQLTGSATDGRTISNSASRSLTRNGHTFGNIGVTTTQQMLEAEREVVQFNIYDFIVKSFCDKFVLGVW